jgi:tetratricopeptide (TPR) repeat protein
LYPLLPAPHFAGRETLLQQLTTWATDPAAPVRVTALVAQGGTGKTAVAERALASIVDADRLNGGVFAWSFDENPLTDAFLKEAARYVLGQISLETGSLLEPLQQGLAGDVPHFLILDGLERVQADGNCGRPRGVLEDPLMRRFLQWIAAGKGTRAKALVTSRFPLPDLTDWKTTGFREDLLDDLDPPAARAVLRKWGVHGADFALDALANQVHQHALTVDVLGSYLGTFCDGNPEAAPTFDVAVLEADDPKAARLARVLQSYATKLLKDERDLLTRLSALSGGVPVDFLMFMVSSGGSVAGSLAGLSRTRLIQLLERLRRLGLVFRYEVRQQTIFSAHPFLRDFFKKLLGPVKPAALHEAIRFRLAQYSEVRPAKRPTEAALLDRYEQLVDHTARAGRIRDAFQLYKMTLGGYSHLGKTLGENVRGSRILAGLLRLPDLSIELSDKDRWDILKDIALFDRNLGDLTAAANSLKSAITLAQRLKDKRDDATPHHLLSDVHRLAGRLLAARSEAQLAILCGGDKLTRWLSHGYMGSACGLLGLNREAREHFQKASELGSEYFQESSRGPGSRSRATPRPRMRCELREAEWKILTGDRLEALQQLTYVQKLARKSDTERDGVVCELLLGRAFVAEDTLAARRHLDIAREFTSRSGNAEVVLRAYHLATIICRHEGDLHAARKEAEAGVQLADSCGFGLLSIDLRVEEARIQLATREPERAVESLNKALAMSEHPDCQFGWGIADALHLLGIAQSSLGDTAHAQISLKRAIEKRKSLGHPGLQESISEFKKLRA